jgi:hypothetical protein
VFEEFGRRELSLDQAIRAKGFLVEKDSGAEAQGRIESPVRVVRRECHGVDAERRQKAGGYRAIGAWTVDPERPAIDQLDFPAEFKLIPLGVTAEVVMIVEN